MTAGDRLAEALRLNESTAAVVHDPSNTFYLTDGFAGECVVWLTGSRRVIITDFRYTEAAEKAAPGFEILVSDHEHTREKIIAGLCERDAVREIRFESNYLSVEAFEKLRETVGDETDWVPLKKA